MFAHSPTNPVGFCTSAKLNSCCSIPELPPKPYWYPKSSLAMVGCWIPKPWAVHGVTGGAIVAWLLYGEPTFDDDADCPEALLKLEWK